MERIEAIFDELPKSERTLLKHLKEYPFQLKNDTQYGPCFWRVLEDGKELGAIKYYGGRKLAVYVAA